MEETSNTIGADTSEKKDYFEIFRKNHNAANRITQQELLKKIEQEKEVKIKRAS